MILASNFDGLATFFLVTLGTLLALAGLSFLSSARGRFPVLAAPAIGGSLLLMGSLVIARSAVAMGLCAISSVPLMLGILSIGLWSDRKK